MSDIWRCNVHSRKLRRAAHALERQRAESEAAAAAARARDAAEVMAEVRRVAAQQVGLQQPVPARAAAAFAAAMRAAGLSPEAILDMST